MTFRLLAAASLGAALAFRSAPAQDTPPRADLIITGARIYTVDDRSPVVQALAVQGGKVQFAGPVAGAMALRGPSTRVLALRGRTIIPGMVDAHAHLMGLGSALRTVNLVGAKTYDEVIARVAARARQVPAETWIQGRGWDQNLWPVKQFPTHDALSRAVPDHPVVLVRVDGHASLANAKAMAAAGITDSTKDRAGGLIVRSANGAPTGVFVDNAQSLVARVVPAMSAAEAREAVLAAVDEMHKWGLVGIHDAGESRSTIDLFESLAKAGTFDLRAYVMIGDDSLAIEHYFKIGPQSALYDGRLWIRSIKLYADGALGSRGAALLQPYTDDPNNRGLLVSEPQHIEAVAVRALQHGFQVATHAIGDRGNRVVLDAYEAALAEVPTADHRFRVEHAQILNADDIPRFAKLKVIPSMQASHQTSDMRWAGTRLGEARLKGAYAWRSLLRTGVVIPNGSDFPVEMVNPLISFHSAVTRQDAEGWPPGGWYPAERMTREEALKSMTAWPAYAAFQESMMGSLAAGKVADFVVLDRDIMTVPAETILSTKVIATYFGGKAVYERK